MLCCRSSFINLDKFNGETTSQVVDLAAVRKWKLFKIWLDCVLIREVWMILTSCHLQRSTWVHTRTYKVTDNQSLIIIGIRNILCKWMHECLTCRCLMYLHFRFLVLQVFVETVNMNEIEGCALLRLCIIFHVWSDWCSAV